jgi:tetratricopeptide (TPR) repeat protein
MSEGSTLRPGALSALIAELVHAPETPPPPSLGPGDRVGRFELVRKLGRGGFGVVYEARDPDLGRAVALKLVRVGDGAGLREDRLLREAEAAARLSHPNVVVLHDLGRSEHGPYLVMELLRGTPLAARLAGGALAPRETVAIASDVAAAIAHAHAAGVVHRDLTPGNVFLCEDGRAKVLDFGLARAFGHGCLAAGTPGYMAPEQRRGQAEDARTDVFALGVILHRALAGALPFDPEGELAGPAPRLEVPEAPALGALVSRMLSHDPAGRPRDGAAVASELAPIAESLRTRGHPDGAPRRRVLRLAALVALGAVLGVGTALGLLRRAAPAPAFGPDGRITVAVADFANETRDPELDGLSTLLATSLEQSPRLRVVTRSRMLEVLRRLGRDGAARIDEPLARAVGKETGARALLLASIRRFDDRYTVDVRALDPIRDEYLFTAKEEAVGKRSVPELVDRLSARTRLAFREDPAAVAAPATPATAVARDLSAWAHYTRGVDLADRYSEVESAAELREALRLDPELAMAHYELFWNTGAGDPRSLPEAQRLSARLPEKERELVEATAEFAGGRADAARERFRRLVERYPDDKRVAFAAGAVAIAAGDRAGAVALFEQAIRLDPSWFRPLPALMLTAPPERAEPVLRAAAERAVTPEPHALLASFLLTRGDTDGALAGARRYAAENGGVDRHGVLARTLVAREELAEAERALRAAARAGAASTERQIDLAALYAMEGRWRDSSAALQEALGSGVRLEAEEARPQLEAALGRGPALRALVVAAEHPDAPTDPFDRIYVGGPGVGSQNGTFVPLALAGRVAPARVLLARFRKELREHAITALDDVPFEALLDGLAARARRSFPAARRALERYARADPLLGGWVLGETCHLQGDAACAVSALAGFVSRQTVEALPPWRAWAYPRALVFLARAHERRGELGEARRHVERALAIWKNAEPTTPHLDEARALKARLDHGL